MFDAVEVIARNDAVTVGHKGGIPEDFETVGQVFDVFTLGHGLIVRWKANLDRKVALAAARSAGSIRSG